MIWNRMIAVAFLFATCPCAADTLVVPSTAYPTIGDALDDVGEGDVVVVNVPTGGGPYEETVDIAVDVSFTMLAGGAVIWEPSVADQSILTIAATDSAAVVTIDGFTFRDGDAPSGGGLSFSGGQLNMLRCVFDNNNADDGGGAHLTDCVADLRSCTFLDNTATAGAALYYTQDGSTTDRLVATSTDFTDNNGGSSIYIRSQSGARLNFSDITGHTNAGGPSAALDIATQCSETVRLNTCTVASNEDIGIAIVWDSGTGCDPDFATLDVDNSDIRDNGSTGIDSSNAFVTVDQSTVRSNGGAGLSITASGNLSTATIEPGANILDSWICDNGLDGVSNQEGDGTDNDVNILWTVISGNGGPGYWGGGLSVGSLTNCTVVGNSQGVVADNGTSASASVTINSCILWDTGSPIVQLGAGSVTFNFSDVQGVSATPPIPGMGNIDQDPEFVDAANKNFSLDHTSPCIGTGALGVSMGAIPYVGEYFRRGDLNYDTLVGVADYIALSNLLLMGTAGHPCLDAVDIDDDGEVDGDDLMMLGLVIGGSASLPLPGAMCGPDPTTDTLTCSGVPSCP